MIAGQSPRLQWQPNPGGQTRTVEEAKAIAKNHGVPIMMEKLVSMYKKGAITADHLVVECLHMVDPECPEVVLDGLPKEILEQMLKYLSEYQPQRMRSNYGLQPASDQV